jgi:hypothetical protein
MPTSRVCELHEQDAEVSCRRGDQYLAALDDWRGSKGEQSGVAVTEDRTA